MHRRATYNPVEFPSKMAQPRKNLERIEIDFSKIKISSSFQWCMLSKILLWGKKVMRQNLNPTFTEFWAFLHPLDSDDFVLCTLTSRQIII